MRLYNSPIAGETSDMKGTASVCHPLQYLPKVPIKWFSLSLCFPSGMAYCLPIVIQIRIVIANAVNCNFYKPSVFAYLLHCAASAFWLAAQFKGKGRPPGCWLWLAIRRFSTQGMGLSGPTELCMDCWPGSFISHSSLYTLQIRKGWRLLQTWLSG